MNIAGKIFGVSAKCIGVERSQETWQLQLQVSVSHVAVSWHIHDFTALLWTKEKSSYNHVTSY